MSGGGEVRLLRPEPGQESPRMPAWKREILERRKAKGVGSGGAGTPESGPGGAGSQRVNGDAGVGVNVNGGTGSGSGRNYTITTASQHFNNKEPRPGPVERSGAPEESLVLQESLGPLEENPFIKLEKERRRRQDRDAAAPSSFSSPTSRPMQHILELYGSVPGIRTIRAENIIIIESDPDYLLEQGDGKTGTMWMQNGAGFSSLSELLDRRGSSITEIRAKEVVIYDTTLSRSEENLSTLGRPDLDDPHNQGQGPGQGRVSRILQKFDSNYGKLQKKSHSTENLLDLDGGSGGRPRLWSKPQPDLVPKPRPGPLPGVPSSSSSSAAAATPQASWSPKPKPRPTIFEQGSPQRHVSIQPTVSSFRQKFEGAPRDEPDRLERSQTKPSRERDREAADMPPKPKVPCSPETRRARAESPTIPMTFKVPRPSPEFEIRPAPKPDLEQIPDGDAQARALASLRLQSRNSFTVVPKTRLTAPPTQSRIPASPVKSLPPPRLADAPTPAQMSPQLHSVSTKRSIEDTEIVERGDKSEPPPASAMSSDSIDSPLPHPASPVVASPPSSPLTSGAPLDSVVSPPTMSTPLTTQLSPNVDNLPITNIDDIEVEPPSRVPLPSPMVHRKKGNTFTVVPKRRVESDAQPSSPEPQHEVLPKKAPVLEAAPGSTPPQAPYAQLGTLLKKRYPAVEDIQVIGGYLSLSKSCLAKMGSAGKKLKISFNESSLHSTYEYPSESSVWDSGEEDEEERTDEQPSMVGRIHIPRPSIITSPTHGNSNNDLSSYVPKHEVDFSAWQEHKHDESIRQEEGGRSLTPETQEVMLTPADSSSLSDYSSEPALYF